MNKKSAFLFIGLVSTSALATANAGEYIDVDTETKTGLIMHYCGSGLMSGHHNKNNQLLCNVVHTNSRGFNDYYTMRHGMHACPAGTAMSGIHVKNNVLKCNKPAGRTLDMSTEYVDNDGFRFGMHACPENWVMTGTHINNNQLLCVKLR